VSIFCIQLFVIFSFHYIFISFFRSVKESEREHGDPSRAVLVHCKLALVGPPFNVKGNSDPKAKKGELRETFIAPKAVQVGS